MKLVSWMAGIMLGLGCVMVAVWQVQAQAAPGAVAEKHGDLAVVAVASPTGDSIVVVDRQQRKMAVYRLGDNGSTIQLRSVRDLRWDLMLEEFNPSNPRPADVRAMLDPR